MIHPNLFVTSESAVIRKDRIEAIDISEDKRTVLIYMMTGREYTHEMQWTELKDWDAEYEALIEEIWPNPMVSKCALKSGPKNAE